MKEKIRNILLPTIMIISILGIILTIDRVKNNSIRSENNTIRQEINNGASPDMNISPANDKYEQGDRLERPDGENQNRGEFFDRGKEREKTMQTKLSDDDVVVIILFSGALSLSLIYLGISFKDKKFYENKDKIVIYILSSLLLTTWSTLGTIIVTNNLTSNFSIGNEKNDKDETNLDKSNTANEKEIDLDDQNTDITIKSGGTYIFTGNFKHSIIVDADDEEVELVLNGVDITTKDTSAIIGLSASKIKITLAENTENTLGDGGNSEYDGCIFSNAMLIFDGKGTLIVNGNQKDGEGIATEEKDIIFNGGTYIITANDDGINAGGDGATITFNGGNYYIDASGDGIDSNKDAVFNGGTIFVMGNDVGGDAGIDTDDGFTINGGTVIALGSDMIETPLAKSKQKSIVLCLDEKIPKNTVVTLMKDDEVITSWSANKSFKTIIVSSEDLKDGEYSLYVGGSNSGELVNGIYNEGKYTKGTKIKIDDEDSFKVSKQINIFGNSSRKS